MGHACETGKPQQDSSARGGQFVPRRAADTASSKPLRAIKTQNHGKPWQGSSPKRKPIPPQRVLWGMHAKQGNLSRIERKGWSIRPLTGCRNSIFETVKSKAKPWQTVAGFKPQAEANSTSKGSVGHACETGKPQDSSARGGQFVP